MRRIAASSFALVALGSIFVACGGSSSSTTSGASSSSGSSSSGSTSSGSGGAGGGGSHVIACDGQPAKLALDGTWVAYGKLGVKLKGADGGAITVCPADQTGESTLLLMLDVKANATDPTKLDQVSATLCSIELPVVTALVGACDPSSKALVSAQIEAPQAFLDALPKIATTPVAGKLGGASPGSSFSLDRLNVTVGSSKSDPNLPIWNTSDPACSGMDIGRTSMCETKCVSDCPSMRDDDGDGFPGVTVDVCGFTSSDTMKGVRCNPDMPSMPGPAIQGRAFIDIQVDPQLTGTAKSSCELLGSVDTSVLYNVTGADITLEGQPIGVTSAIKSLPTFTVSAADSKFRMVRIDGKYGAPNFMVDPAQGIAACKTIISRVNEIQ